MFELTDAAISKGILRDLPFEFYAVMLSQVLNGILTLMESGNLGMSQDEIVERRLDMLWTQ